MSDTESNENPEFRSFGKMARLSRDCVITEKIDGTNAQVFITDDFRVFAGSRNRWIKRGDDNFGFAKWVWDNLEGLRELGPGRHFGEWWGSGIQRAYGHENGERFFSLFNSTRWCQHGETPRSMPTLDPRVARMQEVAPECCRVVPELYRGEFASFEVDAALTKLRMYGSLASSGFWNPEGVVVFHTAGNVGFKKTLKDDSLPKSVTDRRAS